MNDLTKVGCTLMLVLAVIIAAIYPSMMMFEYSLYTITGKDVSAFMDFLGAVVLNGLNFPLFVFCLFWRALGYDIPIVE